MLLPQSKRLAESHTLESRQICLCWSTTDMARPTWSIIRCQRMFEVLRLESMSWITWRSRFSTSEVLSYSHHEHYVTSLWKLTSSGSLL